MGIIRQSHSIKRHFLVYFSSLLATTVALLIFFTFYSMYTYMGQLSYCNEATLDLYVYEIESQMQDLEAFNQELYANSYDFRLLAQDNTTSAARLASTYHLYRSMKSRVTASSGIIIFDTQGEINMYQFGSTLQATADNIKMSRIIRDYWLTANDQLYYSWHALTSGNYSLLTNVYRLNNLFVCSVINLNRLSITKSDFSDASALRFALYTEDAFLTNQADMAALSLTPKSIRETPYSLFFSPFRDMIQTTKIDQSDISLCCVMPTQRLWSYSRWSMVIIASLFAVMCGLIVLIYTLIKKILIYPLNQISHATENLLSDHRAEVTAEPSRIEELQRINDALNSLLLQKEALERENYNQTYEKEHAMLQYYQLQTRSHFFINCLKSLYGMTESNERERMRRMILAFSNHLRYVFHDNLLLVTLKAELDEVLDYYNIILADRRSPVLLTQTIEPGLTQCKVPPLIIQTFLENACKYNGNPDKLLHFTVQIDRIDLEDQPHLRIRLKDNGVGYDQDTLQKLNATDDRTYPAYHIGINNLKRRIGLIYHDRYQIAFFTEPQGGACALICLPITE
jgi:two-component system, sensor histidine kinase YesM